jgi:hypothetical protein
LRGIQVVNEPERAQVFVLMAGIQTTAGQTVRPIFHVRFGLECNESRWIL